MIIQKSLSFIIILACIVVIVSFFMPWVKGQVSILKPLDKITKKIQEADNSGLVKETITTTKKTIDSLTEAATKKKSTKILAGHQIPLHAVKKEGSSVYFLYGVPSVAVLICLLVILGNRMMYFDFFATLVALGAFIALIRQAPLFERGELFIDTEILFGLNVTLYSFLTIGGLSSIKFLTHREIRDAERRKRK